ncbi:hypothetical protein K2173_022033 [Erythroxylum novogranatense]|uniref:TIR domain-containing protein n=1 Tax=Erythroxylum novogranatense TaxID=1862640 RepID=A0AAV8T3Z3_9ROSI|nr:hypothetical protein K2173_022033 [Erythroxylum novogranatense]
MSDGPTSPALAALRLNWDVFISFRVEDTRHGFTKHLYESLKEHGIRAFLDDEGMTHGDKIPTRLLDAIEDSALSIIVISPRYADSHWCLEELARICELGRLMIPVFYEVNPSHVRGQKGPFENDFRNHLERFGKESVDKWRRALERVGSLKGFPFDSSKQEQIAIQRLVERVLTEMRRTPVGIANYTVGIANRIYHQLNSRKTFNISTTMSDGPTSPAPAALRPYWDVFISFRGEDTRHGFTKHLYESLQEHGIRAFLDDEGMTLGDKITTRLLDAIEDSALSIIVISPRYADSHWCLEELARICALGRLMIPVFYEVDPSHVRRQKGPFENDFRNQLEMFGKESVDKWRRASETAGKLKGFPCRSRLDEVVNAMQAQEQRFLMRKTETTEGAYRVFAKSEAQEKFKKKKKKGRSNSGTSQSRQKHGNNKLGHHFRRRNGDASSSLLHASSLQLFSWCPLVGVCIFLI